MIRELAIGLCLGTALTIAARAKCSISAADQKLVAAVLVAEAGGESDRRAIPAILEVIRNRAKYNGQNLAQVVTSRLQFSCLDGVTNLEDFVASQEQHPRFAEAMKLVRNRKRTNYTHGARFYHRDNILPDWAKGAKVSAWLGRTKFYSELKQ